MPHTASINALSLRPPGLSIVTISTNILGMSGMVITSLARPCIDGRPSRRFYAAYVDYFTSELLQKGLERCLEEYIFSPEANFGAAFPEMLSRLVEGALHPLIHVGYGAEFSSIGISAEG